MNKKVLIGILCAAGLGSLLWSTVQTVSNPSWEQPTMGTVCRITLSGPIPKIALSTLRKEIDAALADVNDRMSVWNPDTEISKFNRFVSTEPFPVSPEFAEVVQRALAFSEMTDGAFDPTVKPLVDRWGFGSAVVPIPTGNRDYGETGRSLRQQQSGNAEGEEALDQIMQTVGWQKVRLESGALIKSHPHLQLDLAAIAKGYGVDGVAAVIRTSGRTNFLVEIGGEIVAAGTSPSGKPWRIGIESPEPGKAFGEEIFQIIELSDLAMATSGDYRNFQLRADGTRYSHIMDPRTGKPAVSDVAAVTVIAERCMDADAVATALFVMGSEKGLAWVEASRDFEALFIVHTADGGFTSRASSGFPANIIN
jgi:thiamine biosynthesis lipoprotein